MITELDGRDIDDATAGALADLRSACLAEVLPDDPPTPAAEVADDLRLAPSAIDNHVFLAWDENGERLDGACVVEVEDRPEHAHLAYPEVLVPPDRRRRGIGTALLRPAVERCVELGRTTLLGGSWGAAGLGFGAALGADPGLVEHCNRLRIADVERDLLDVWIGRAGERAADYSLVAYDTACPEDLVDQVADVLASMNDAPKSDLMPDMVFTSEQVRQWERSERERGRKLLGLCARHDPSGELAGITQLVTNRHRPWLVDQGDTGVLPAHRDRGIGRWLKAANLRRLVDQHPEARLVETWNAGSNAAMLGINHALGFSRVWAVTELEVETVGLGDHLATLAG